MAGSEGRIRAEEWVTVCVLGRALMDIVQVQINELGMIRQALYELESQHQRVREKWVLVFGCRCSADACSYEREISRLKAELVARGGTAEVVAGPGSPPRDPERLSYPRPDLPGSLQAPPPLNGEAGELLRSREPGWSS